MILLKLTFTEKGALLNQGKRGIHHDRHSGNWKGSRQIEWYSSRRCDVWCKWMEMVLLWEAMVVGERDKLEDGGDRKVTYAGVSRKCMVVKEGMGMEEVQRIVTEITGNDLTDHKLWYIRLGDGNEGEADVRMFLKGNDEHGYFYVGESDGPKRRTQKACASCEGRTRSCDHSVVCGRSERNRDDVVQESRKGAGLKRAVGSESSGCIGDDRQTRLRLGREIIELSDDDEISVVSEDVGDEEIAVEEGEEGSKGRGLMKGVTLMTTCDHDQVYKRKATTAKKFGKKVDKHKQDIMKWRNGVGERIEQKLADTYKKIGCIASVECYSLMSGEYSVELTNSHKLVANLWVYDYAHPIYKTVTQQLIYSQLVHPTETHDMGTVDGKTGQVIVGDELDDDYDRCILPPTMAESPVDCRRSGGTRHPVTKCGNAHEDHDKYAAVKPIATPL
ncbi:LOW QUALITY PROTEIN: hypothetical protein Cgig2_003806 [Carnegiea gigantea]|uniref:Uncharacterized protein n=1 Tax=Carnegiea gigantea TaxID=171969 RepID=A0A9Q1K6B6_9CARY|nr:LOW QUALITY PROTEIN: hypothetical protein Cgig2_003806 [Carnegiea gigantea]